MGAVLFLLKSRPGSTACHVQRALSACAQASCVIWRGTQSLCLLGCYVKNLCHMEVWTSGCQRGEQWCDIFWERSCHFDWSQLAKWQRAVPGSWAGCLNASSLEHKAGGWKWWSKFIQIATPWHSTNNQRGVYTTCLPGSARKSLMTQIPKASEI